MGELFFNIMFIWLMVFFVLLLGVGLLVCWGWDWLCNIRKLLWVVVVIILVLLVFLLWLLEDKIIVMMVVGMVMVCWIVVLVVVEVV